jgi:ubiquinone/menaquinone biosynthesis C-methylase UbiE
MILAIAEDLNGDVLDVGCGEGLLVERLAKVSRSVTGIDGDEQALNQARARVAALANAAIRHSDFMEIEVVPDSYDLLTFVAVLHHLDLEGALRQSAEMLRPGGRLLVVGLSANKSAADYARSALLVLPVRLMSRIHHEDRTVKVIAIPPKESFSEIALTVHRLLPGARLRRAPYYRYVLDWTKPQRPSSVG